MQKLFYAFIILCLTSCAEQGEQPYRADFFVFGTLVGISIWGVPDEQAEKATQVVIQELQTMHNDWHAWHPSQITELNQVIAQGGTVTIQDQHILTLLQRAQQFSQQSDDLFNPTIGKLIELWGFHHDELPQNPPPTDEAIAQLVNLKPTMADIVITDNQISSHNPAVQLDLGAFAKGYAVDLAIKRLGELGIENAIVNAGGNLKAIGKMNQRPWMIGIRDPNGEDVLAGIAIEGEESVITSGNYERYLEYQGVRYSHILDPRTGKPAKDFSSVSVIDPNATLADAAATALSIAGLQDWYRIAKQMGVKNVILVDVAGNVYLNPRMAARVQFNPKKKPNVVITGEL